MKWLALLFVLSLAASSCAVDPNDLETLEGDLVLQAEVTNGRRYLVGTVESKDYLYVAKLKGTHFEMGKAFGQLFKEELK